MGLNWIFKYFEHARYRNCSCSSIFVFFEFYHYAIILSSDERKTVKISVTIFNQMINSWSFFFLDEIFWIIWFSSWCTYFALILQCVQELSSTIWLCMMHTKALYNILNVENELKILHASKFMLWKWKMRSWNFLIKKMINRC